MLLRRMQSGDMTAMFVVRRWSISSPVGLSKAEKGWVSQILSPSLLAVAERAIVAVTATFILYIALLKGGIRIKYLSEE